MGQPVQLLDPLEVHSQRETPADSVSNEPERKTQSQEESITVGTLQVSFSQEPRQLIVAYSILLRNGLSIAEGPECSGLPSLGRMW